MYTLVYLVWMIILDSSLQRFPRSAVNIFGLTLCGAHPIAMSRWKAALSRITLLNHFDVLAPSGDDESWWSEGSKDFSDDLELSGVGHVIRPAEQVLLKSRRLRRFQSALFDNAVVWSNTSLHVSLLMHWLGQSEHVSLSVLAFLVDVDMTTCALAFKAHFMRAHF